jgi:hypothetical protein
MKTIEEVIAIVVVVVVQCAEEVVVAAVVQAVELPSQIHMNPIKTFNKEVAEDVTIMHR